MTFTLTKLKVGKNKLTITWAGDANGTGGTKTFKIKINDAQQASQEPAVLLRVPGGARRQRRPGPPSPTTQRNHT